MWFFIASLVVSIICLSILSFFPSSNYGHNLMSTREKIFRFLGNLFSVERRRSLFEFMSRLFPKNETTLSPDCVLTGNKVSDINEIAEDFWFEYGSGVSVPIGYFDENGVVSFIATPVWDENGKMIIVFHSPFYTSDRGSFYGDEGYPIPEIYPN